MDLEAARNEARMRKLQILQDEHGFTAEDAEDMLFLETLENESPLLLDQERTARLEQYRSRIKK